MRLATPLWLGEWATIPQPAVPKAAALPVELSPNVGVTGENRTLVGWFTASRLNHSATVTSGAGSGARIRVCWASTSRYTVSAIPANLVEMERIELSFDGCRPSVLPLNDIPVVAGDGNAPSRLGL